jgi:hypothetical protein
LPIKRTCHQHISSSTFVTHITKTLINNMSHFPLVYISSDDSTNSEINYYSDSDFDSDAGWSGYFPPDAASSTNPKPNKKMSVPAPSPSLANELPQALTQALESAIKNMKWPAQRKPERPERPPKQILGLACPRKQASFDDQRKTTQKGKQSYQGKGKRPME